MRTRSIATLAGLCLIILAAASCNKEQGSYRGIRFQAKSYGYLGVPGAADTKTTYTGQMTGTTERIEWTKGDLIRIVSDKAYMLDDENIHQCDFCVDGHTEEGAVSSASIAPVDAANALQWQTGEHHFWAMYPSPATAGVPAGAALSSTGTMTFAIPATQVVTKSGSTMTFLPNMKQAPMLAHKVTTPSASVPLEFTPQFTAFEFTVSKGSLPGVTLTGFRLIRMDDTGFTGTLAGTYTVAFDDGTGKYATTPTVTGGASTEIAIDWSATDNRIVLDADHPDFTFTVFALPETLKGLKIEFTGRFSNTGEDFTQTRSLRLRSAAGEALNFLPFLKYKIYGLSFPEMVDATIEDSIDWDYSVAIMDNVTWWLNADSDVIDWQRVLSVNGLEEKISWFFPAEMNDKVGWEQLDHLSLNDDADAYLWRTQTVQRAVTAYATTGGAYSDVQVAWSASPSGVVNVNVATGLVRAIAPGTATVTATVTPNDGSAPMAISYTVYVNAPTGITLTAAKNFVKPSGTVGLTATVTCTSNGTISSYPDDMLEWSSANTSYITVSGDAQPAAATGVATATATGVANGTSTLTISVSAKYADGVSATLTDYPCRIDGSMGGVYLSRGILEKPIGESTLTLTDGSDPFELLKYYNNNGNVNELNPAVGGNISTTKQRHFFNFIELGNYFGGYGLNGNTFTTESGDIPSTNLVSYDGYYWRMPTKTEYYVLMGNSDGGTIPVRDGATVSDGSSSVSAKHYCLVLVDLTGSTYAGKGLSNASWTSSAGTNTNYIGGVILFPDNATITCSSLDISKCNSSGYSSISASELIALCSGETGCIFMPVTGYGWNGGSFGQGGYRGYFGIGTKYPDNNSNCYLFRITQDHISTNSTDKEMLYSPTHLVRVDD